MGSILSCILKRPDGEPRGGPNPQPTNENQRHHTLSCRQISWSEIYIDNVEANTLGKSSFGILIRAILRKSGNNDVKVEINAVTKDMLNGSQPLYLEKCSRAHSEVLSIKKIEDTLIDNECIVRTYGVCEGPLPARIADLFQCRKGVSAVGIVTRCELGGTLDNRLHVNVNPLSVEDRLILLDKIAKALTELHSCGVIHGDIRSRNVWLTDHQPPDVRFSGFGLSRIIDIPENIDILGSSLTLTASAQVTESQYRAPEMVRNHLDSNDERVAAPSRKTDMYAFAILSWEILARTVPFDKITETQYYRHVLQSNLRLDLKLLPPEVPKAIIEMIESCWSADRMERKSAVECVAIIQHSLDVLSSRQFDIFLSHSWTSKTMLSHVYQILTKQGYRVWYDQSDTGDNIQETMKERIISSKVFIACLNKKYQENSDCMYALRTASLYEPRPIIALITEAEPFAWTTDEVQNLCKLRNTMFVDISAAAALAWEEENEPSKTIVIKLRNDLNTFNLFKLLHEKGVKPSIT